MGESKYDSEAIIKIKKCYLNKSSLSKSGFFALLSFDKRAKLFAGEIFVTVEIAVVCVLPDLMTFLTDFHQI